MYAKGEQRQFTKYFELLYSPRTTLSLENSKSTSFRCIALVEKLFDELTMSFDPFTTITLRNEFVKVNNKMTKGNFILSLRDHLLQWQPRIPNRVLLLTKLLGMLFEQMDMNCKGHVAWEEFSAFLVDRASVINKHVVTKQTGEHKLYSVSEARYGKELPDSTHKTVYIPELERIALIQEKHPVINFISPKDASTVGPPLDVVGTTFQDVTKKLSQETILKKSVLGIVYIEEYKLLVTSSDDKMLRLWQLHTSNFVEASPSPATEAIFKEQAIECKAVQYCLAWDTYHKLLYSGQKDGTINQWSLREKTPIGTFEGPTRKELKEVAKKAEIGEAATITKSEKLEADLAKKDDKKKWRQRLYEDEEQQPIRHTDVITDLLPLPKLLFLASTSLDQKVILWDTITRKARRVYAVHKKGVNALAYSDELIMLFSAGYDHEICIWNPYIDHLIYKITGHTSPITSLCIMPGTPQLISGDIDGFVKIWDLRNMSCVQTINVQLQIETYKFGLCKVLAIGQYTKIAAIGRNVLFYDYDKDYNPKLVDEHMPLCVELHPTTLEFVVPVGKVLKIWDALTGKLKKIYKDLTKADITLFLFDDKKKRFLVGDAEGNMTIYNYFTGTSMKTLAKHNGAVTCGVFCPISKLVYTGSNRDEELAIHDDKVMNQSIRIRTLRNEKYYPQKFGTTKNGFIVIGFSNGIIKIYENDASRTVESFYAHQSEIIDMNVFQEYPFVVASDASGKMGLWVIPPGTSRAFCLYNWRNTDDKGEDSVINAIAIAERLRLIYTADDKGMIKAYSYNSMIETLKITDPRNANKELFNKLDGTVIKGLTMELQWKISTYAEGANSLTFVDQEPYFLVTTCYNRMAYIINAHTGEKIDCIQQGMNNTPDPIGYKLKEKYKNFAAVEKKRILTEGEKASGSLFNKPILRVESEAEEEKLVGKSNEWGLVMDIKSIRERYSEKEERVLHEVGSTSKVRTPRTPPIQPTHKTIEEIGGFKLPQANEQPRESPENHSEFKIWEFSPDTTTRGFAIGTETGNIAKSMERGKGSHGYNKLAPKVPLTGKVKEADEKMAALFDEVDGSPEGSVLKSAMRSKFGTSRGPTSFKN